MNFIKKEKSMSEGSIIYISLGTVFNDNKPFWESVIKEFTKLPQYKVIISCGNKQPNYELLKSFNPPAHISVELWVE